MTLQIKTRSEQKLEWLESLHRPLTEAESDELRRSLHAIRWRNDRLAKAARIEKQMHAAALAEHDRDNAELLVRMEAEMRG